MVTNWYIDDLSIRQLAAGSKWKLYIVLNYNHVRKTSIKAVLKEFFFVRHIIKCCNTNNTNNIDVKKNVYYINDWRYNVIS